MQRKAYRAYLAAQGITYTVLCSRRWGKTIFATVLCWITALTRPGAIIRYSAPTKGHGRQFVEPAFARIAAHAPPHLRPRWMSQDNTWVFPNGSKVHLGSCETESDVDAQVGTECHLSVIDEAGKIRSELLRKLIKSIILPQLLTTRETGSRCVVLGTPAVTPNHYFHNLCDNAVVDGTITTHTIEDCAHVSPEALAELLHELGGPDSTEAQRELWCKFVTEKSRAILPEFADRYDAIVRPVTRPRHFDAYTAWDTGYKDLSVAALGYYNFELDALVIEDEVVDRQIANITLARRIQAKERELWGSQIPLRRWIDAPEGTTSDIHTATSKDEQGNPCTPITFAQASKYDSNGALNRVRTKITEGRIIIHPRCKTIIQHCKNGIWNIGRTDYDRAEGHHWDGISAVKYLVRSVEWGRNPAPQLPVIDHTTQVWSPKALAQAPRDQFGLPATGPKTMADIYKSRGKR